MQTHHIYHLCVLHLNTGATLPSLECARKVIHLIFHMENNQSAHYSEEGSIYNTLYMIYMLYTMYYTIYTISHGGRREVESVDVCAR